MPVTAKSKQHQELFSSLIRLLTAKYEQDREIFREFLPEVARLLDSTFPAQRAKKMSFSLTERERKRRADSLNAAMEALESNELDRPTAVHAMEDYAVLTLDNTFSAVLDYPKRDRLFKAALGKGVGSITAKETITLRLEGEAKPVHRVALIRGVQLNLTWDAKLVSVSVVPVRLKERGRLFDFVGAGKDTASDVAAKHDRYLTELSPHGAS